MKFLLNKYQTLTALAVALSLSLFVFVPTLHAAPDCSSGTLSTKQALECGSNGASGTGQTADKATSNLNTTVSTVINLLSVGVGIIAVIMVVIGGLRYVTSAGKQESVQSAKNTILYAIIGLVIVAFAQIIVQFVLDKSVNGSPTTATSASGSGTPGRCTPSCH